MTISAKVGLLCSVILKSPRDWNKEEREKSTNNSSVYFRINHEILVKSTLRKEHLLIPLYMSLILSEYDYSYGCVPRIW